MTTHFQSTPTPRVIGRRASGYFGETWLPDASSPPPPVPTHRSSEATPVATLHFYRQQTQRLAPQEVPLPKSPEKGVSVGVGRTRPQGGKMSYAGSGGGGVRSVGMVNGREGGKGGARQGGRMEGQTRAGTRRNSVSSGDGTEVEDFENASVYYGVQRGGPGHFSDGGSSSPSYEGAGSVLAPPSSYTSSDGRTMYSSHYSGSTYGSHGSEYGTGGGGRAASAAPSQSFGSVAESGAAYGRLGGMGRGGVGAARSEQGCEATRRPTGDARADAFVHGEHARDGVRMIRGGLLDEVSFWMQHVQKGRAASTTRLMGDFTTVYLTDYVSRSTSVAGSVMMLERLFPGLQRIYLRPDATEFSKLCWDGVPGKFATPSMRPGFGLEIMAIRYGEGEGEGEGEDEGEMDDGSGGLSPYWNIQITQPRGPTESDHQDIYDILSQVNYKLHFGQAPALRVYRLAVSAGVVATDYRLSPLIHSDLDLGALTDLDLSGVVMDWDSIRAIAQCGRFNRVRKLSLHVASRSGRARNGVTERGGEAVEAGLAMFLGEFPRLSDFVIEPAWSGFGPGILPALRSCSTLRTIGVKLCLFSLCHKGLDVAQSIGTPFAGDFTIMADYMGMPQEDRDETYPDELASVLSAIYEPGALDVGAHPTANIPSLVHSPAEHDKVHPWVQFKTLVRRAAAK